jgi:hypothetical protein
MPAIRIALAALCLGAAIGPAAAQSPEAFRGQNEVRDNSGQLIGRIDRSMGGSYYILRDERGRQIGTVDRYDSGRGFTVRDMRGNPMGTMQGNTTGQPLYQGNR